ncbi:uncharacterized protein BYT42DRAFT_602563 [Radiomyces spectabilis]|uniref:uncharacterized protein n=1 Tax=Radiomyces spectabilis TaxID=64574 RepID=UPI00221EA128|nr:uncharacterized protein BYT42DRAFT_602563 [Radiomyces spectabilis]KAI8391819.1 hypothetical protein BYT42DRAFT_602563 [Radiomyces spectabilis]
MRRNMHILAKYTYRQIDETVYGISHPASCVSSSDEMECEDVYALSRSGSEVPAEIEDDSLDGMECWSDEEMLHTSFGEAGNIDEDEANDDDCDRREDGDALESDTLEEEDDAPNVQVANEESSWFRSYRTTTSRHLLEKPYSSASNFIRKLSEERSRAAFWGADRRHQRSEVGNSPTSEEIDRKDLNGSALAQLPIIPPFIYPLDMVHLLGPGVGKQIFKLLQGQYGKQNSNNPFFLPPSAMEKIGACMEKSKFSVLSGFCGDCGDISKNAGFYKAVDWIHFVLYTVPRLVLERIDDVDAKLAIAYLTKLYNLVCRRKITSTQLKQIIELSMLWLRALIKFNCERKVDDHDFTISQHYLLHLYKVIQYVGLLSVYAVFAMERTIGEVKRNITSRKEPVANSQNTLVILAAPRYFEQSSYHETRAHRPQRIIAVSDGQNEPELWGPFGLETVGSMNISTTACAGLVTSCLQLHILDEPRVGPSTFNFHASPDSTKIFIDESSRHKAQVLAIQSVHDRQLVLPCWPYKTASESNPQLNK